MRLHSLTPSEAKVAEYCLAKPDAVIDNSIHDVAREAGVSVASVSRLAATLGYRDWKDMRLSLAKDAGSASANGSAGAADNPVYPEIRRGDSDDDVVEKVFNGNILSLKNTIRQIDKDKIIEVAKKVRKTDTVVFFGAGGSGYLAMDEALRFSHLRVTAHACTEDYLMMLHAAKMRKGQIAFGFSNSGRSRSTVNALAEAGKCGATTVGIASFPNTPLEKASEYFFQTSFPFGGGMTASLTARLALGSIMDAVYVLAAQHGGMSDRFKHMDDLLEIQLRVPDRKK
jgi:DNA-binding MurR/RpiR family transcriptional regulator